jgi:nitrogen fixation protein
LEVDGIERKFEKLVKCLAKYIPKKDLQVWLFSD